MFCEFVSAGFVAADSLIWLLISIAYWQPFRHWQMHAYFIASSSSTLMLVVIAV